MVKISFLTGGIEEDREHTHYSIDGLIQHAKTRMAYKKQKPNAVVELGF